MNKPESVVDELLRERRAEVEAERAADQDAERLYGRAKPSAEEFFARHGQRVARVMERQALRRRTKARAA